MHDERFRDCVAHQAQYLFETFGKFPATIPSLMILNYVQAHHLDLDFYDEKFRPGSYLRITRAPHGGVALMPAPTTTNDLFHSKGTER